MPKCKQSMAAYATIMEEQFARGRRFEHAIHCYSNHEAHSCKGAEREPEKEGVVLLTTFRYHADYTSKSEG